MKHNEATIFVFIASIVIGILISLNFNLKSQKKYVPLNSKQYQEALKQRNLLYSDITKVKYDNRKIRNKINEYTHGDAESDKLVSDVKREIDINNILEGLTPVHGEGIKILIKDASNKLVNSNKDFAFTGILHDHDMINVVNELKFSGAEAISINNERVVSNTSIFCSGPFLEINKINTPEPFSIYAIGNPDLLVENLNKDESYVKGLMNRGLKIEIIKENNIKLPAYKGIIPVKNLNFDIK